MSQPRCPSSAVSSCALTRSPGPPGSESLACGPAARRGYQAASSCGRPGRMGNWDQRCPVLLYRRPPCAVASPRPACRLAAPASRRPRPAQTSGDALAQRLVIGEHRPGPPSARRRQQRALGLNAALSPGQQATAASAAGSALDRPATPPPAWLHRQAGSAPPPAGTTRRPRRFLDSPAAAPAARAIIRAPYGPQRILDAAGPP